jgi:hypothetical protein
MTPSQLLYLLQVLASETKIGITLVLHILSRFPNLSSSVVSAGSCEALKKVALEIPQQPDRVAVFHLDGRPLSLDVCYSVTPSHRYYNIEAFDSPFHTQLRFFFSGPKQGFCRGTEPTALPLV